MTKSGRSKRQVVIVGGGLAGLSAAESLARYCRAGASVTLLESKRNVGGRAGSFTDPATDQAVDYCQHVTMGCCTNLIALLDRCGLGDSLERHQELVFVHPQFPNSFFAPSRWLPAPLHLSSAIKSLRYLDSRQKREIRRGMWRLFRTASETRQDQTAADWLRRQGQSDDTIRDFWGVVLVSALGEQVDIVTMHAARKVFVDGFAAARGASDVLIPNQPLSTLFGQRLRQAIEAMGVVVRDGQHVSTVQRAGDGVQLRCGDGSHYQADHVVMAVPWHGLHKLVSPTDLSHAERYARIPSSPVTGLHLWFDRQLTDRPHAVIIDSFAQWLFRQPWSDDAPGENGYYYQIVISASRDVRSMPKQELIEEVVTEIRSMFPQAREAKLLRSRVVTDPHSVFSVRGEVEAIRPSARTPLSWLHLAGDWIATGWPATMEGAVIGGRMAASSIAETESWGRIDIDPGLPRRWLARRLIRD